MDRSFKYMQIHIPGRSLSNMNSSTVYLVVMERDKKNIVYLVIIL